MNFKEEWIEAIGCWMNFEMAYNKKIKKPPEFSVFISD